MARSFRSLREQDLVLDVADNGLEEDLARSSTGTLVNAHPAGDD
jgi:hypothetical protein